MSHSGAASTPLQVARLIFEHYGKGEIDAILDLTHADVVLETDEESRSQTRYEGHEGLRRVMVESRAAGEGEVETFDFDWKEDRVLVLGWRHPRRGVRDRQTRAWALEIRDGKLQKMTITTDRRQALSSAGFGREAEPGDPGSEGEAGPDRDAGRS